MRPEGHMSSEWKDLLNTKWKENYRITFRHVMCHQGGKEDSKSFQRGIKQTNSLVSDFVMATPVVEKQGNNACKDLKGKFFSI